ncbi:MAG: hypothetical protein ABI806_12695 [Candidatus Solibacter sp.]
MKILAVVSAATMVSGMYGQAVHRSFGSVVFPGGTSGTSSNVTRNFGSVVFPGGMQTAPVYGGAQAIPTTRPGPGNGGGRGGKGGGQYPAPGGAGHRGSRGSGGGLVYAYPVYVGGGYDYSMQPQESAPAPAQTPNITIVMPPQTANPVMIQADADGEYTTTRPRTRVYEEPRRRVEEPETPEPTKYLLAFKDHTIYSAVAYWADGDTLHYFTNGNTHNQASMSLIDRSLTERLNREMGIEFHLPPAK